MKWRQYHESTKHSIESLAQARHGLDWANMPDPFRHYEGVPVLDLPADPPEPQMPALEVLLGGLGSTPVSDGPTFLSQLLFHSAAISATKRTPSSGCSYALRVNPSSGNLHPTEFHFITRNLKGWADGLYHYDPSRHMAEQRGRSNFEMKLADSSAPIVFVLSSIARREAWKYGERAYRYCLHDMGHAWQALTLAARSHRHVRLRVLERDGWRCQFCGRGTNLEVHHRTFRSHLGGDSEENLVTACHQCHRAAHGLS